MNGFPARKPRWLYAPLIALLISSLAPTTILAIGAIIEGQFWNGELWGGALVLIVILTICNWPFLVLYSYTSKKAKQDWPRVDSVRKAMWNSLILMTLPNIMFVPMAPFMEQGAILWPFILLLIEPILGVVGWRRAGIDFPALRS